ncbi:MAG: hypothetical protein IT184_05685 [Acidobacteria bacterium]|nr:hypothetical protein [Acidobacteriota bacterium]
MASRMSIVLASALFASAAFVGGQGAAEVAGACADVFTGRICTWATTTGGRLVEAGATIPIAVIDRAPAEAPMTWPPVPVAAIDLPAVVQEQTAMRQLTVDWEPGGHPPAPFLTPHFDFHFYTIAPAEIAAIDCRDQRKPAALPAAYTLPDITLPPPMAQMMGVESLVGLCVPRMGMHAIPAADVARPDAFERTMVVGYYRERPIFIEPMIAKATLMKKASFDLPLPAVAGMAGRLPSMFHAEYDATRQAYRFRLSGFASR